MTEQRLTRITHAAHHARTTTDTDETGNAATVQVRVNDMQLVDNVPVLGMFGFQSSLPPGTDVLRVSFQGEYRNGAIVASNHIGSRMKDLAAGSSRQHDQSGSQVLLSNDGHILIQASGQGSVKIVGNVIVVGSVTCTEEVTAMSGGANSVTLSRHQGHANSITPPKPGT